MPVNAVQNVSFASRKANKNDNAKEGKHDKYFKWVSQNQANEALKLSVGREVEDGKYKAVSAFSTLGAFATGLTALFKTLKVSDLSDKYKMMLSQNTADADALKGIGKQITKNKNIAIAAVLATSVLMLVSNAAKSKNFKEAEKTAHERGFFTYSDRQKMKTKENYERTDAVYSSLLKPKDAEQETEQFTEQKAE